MWNTASLLIESDHSTLPILYLRNTRMALSSSARGQKKKKNPVRSLKLTGRPNESFVQGLGNNCWYCPRLLPSKFQSCHTENSPSLGPLICSNTLTCPLAKFEARLDVMVRERGSKCIESQSLVASILHAISSPAFIRRSGPIDPEASRN